MTDWVVPPIGTEPLDAIVIGAGPAGLFSAWRLAVGGAKVALLEAGGTMRDSLCPRVSARMNGRTVRSAEKFRLQCNRCTCLTGLGGAAFHFDINLGYVQGLSRSKIERDGQGGFRTYSGLERALGDFDRAARSVEEVYASMYRLGLPPAQTERPAAGPLAGAGGFALVDDAVSQAITVDEALTVVDALTNEACANGLRLLLGCRAGRVSRESDGLWRVEVPAEFGGVLRARAVVVAVGKLGLGWVRSLLADAEVAHRAPLRVDLGVRLEAPRDTAAPLTASCHNPKLAYLNEQGESVRTFCVCEGGRLMQYAFMDAVVLDGQHCLTTPTERTNFGIITTVDVPAGLDGTEYALGFARRITALGGGRPVVQRVAELLGRDGGGSARTSLVHAAWVDLREALGPRRVADIAGMVERLEELAPGIGGPESVVAAPVVERVYPAIELSDGMESSAPGLFFVGDCSSKIIGVTYGAATGLAAAQTILHG
ncbi:FAD-binding protein [Kitasatospora sp. NBC_01266]|uniref:FAD-binding protein n=1 Tax=Kitasatospora sp. NBC_01266 TaxID=2903572 RepID=UPI002E34D13E|nr:NAD(P)/FAD-dependent oxidoreductase [Kitasatospora sp. NBC_01266]